MSNKSELQKAQPFPPRSYYAYHSDEIDLREVFIALWHGKLWVIGITLIFSICSAIFAYVQPNVYEAKATMRVALNPYLDELNINFKGQQVEVADDLLPYLTQISTKKMIAEVINEPVELFVDIKISTDKKGNISVSKESINPKRAFESVQLYTQQINKVFKDSELEKVQVALKASRSLIESQKGNVLQVITGKYADLLFKQELLLSSDLKLVRVMVEPAFPKTHIKPKRALIVVLGTLLGGMLGVAIVLIRFAFRREDNITE